MLDVVVEEEDEDEIRGDIEEYLSYYEFEEFTQTRFFLSLGTQHRHDAASTSPGHSQLS